LITRHAAPSPEDTKSSERWSVVAVRIGKVDFVCRGLEVASASLGRA